ncbi:uncharacterized protein DUF222 [Pseudonocardia sediminis]|uniref:Uncharacterized protein DUF222 n=1 Tax=Pseudonocardia sediminis TaxID=1397368 RepID=A0A4Q7UYX6_PSEST|nr:HNH endonuclease signature motif containing protein [Pseudonocardia sediminis]RZT85399.1 uncharacterized protein DUF222 [Pseudonocardia sediminis]
MFATSTTGVRAAERPSLARSVWTDLGGGVWRCNPVLTEEPIPELRRPGHARRRLAALTMCSPSDAERAGSSLGADAEVDEPAVGEYGIGGLDGVAVASLVSDALADVRGVEDVSLTDRIIDAERLARFAAGARAELVAEFARRRPGDEATLVCSDRVELGSRWAPDELGLALDLTRLSAKALIGQSVRLATVLPDTLLALRNGVIDERRAEAVCSATLQLPVEMARRVEAIVLPAAPGRTVRQVRERLYRAVHRVDPEGEFRRHKEARVERRVSVQPRENGMSAMWLHGPGVEVEASFTMLTRLAESLGAGDPRTKDQRRFDLAMQTMQGRLTVTDLADVATAVATTQADDAATTTPTAADLDRDRPAGDATTGTGTGTGAESETGAESKSETGAESGAGVDRPDGGDGFDAAGTREQRAAPRADAPAADVEASALDAVDPEPADPDAALPVVDPDLPDPGSADSDAAHARPECPEPDDSPPPPGSSGTRSTDPDTTIPEAALVDAVAAALALRPQVHDTVRKPLIQVVIGLDTLIGADDNPAELIGHGPIPATTARALAADGVWKRLVTDPRSGNLLDHGRTTYRPPVALADHVDARDQYCRFPTCTRRARDSDQDHLRRFEHHGITGDDNLNALCPVHHLLKEHRDWNVLAHPDGTLTWITPTGHRYTSEPYDYRPFTDGPDVETPEPPTELVDDAASGDAVPDDAAETADDDPPPF